MINAAAVATTPTLTGPRIRLVPLGPEHAEAVFTSLQEPESNRLTGTHQTFTRAAIDAYCASRADQDDRLDWAIEDVATGQYAGGVSVNEVDADNETAGFRIDLVESHRGRGLGPEAIELMLAHLFDEVGVYRVGLEVYAFNPRAQRSYEKVGFVVEGRERGALLWDGERVDAVLMGLLRDEWKARHTS
ncbi:GNAT family N-acetyltransferase [Jiangella alba]|uniref:Protein N-acetyltransferase, RimJ/RimL family n=1 Tax=Jiangella alba TaxID=561176 RepID=A0A1H5PPI5_9ACTN|nr:GNAT family protein [Jiangella alba]SEF15604.1 Protein N-acetyltransferase, RimJ/RimL family [Jiangella alba]